MNLFIYLSVVMWTSRGFTTNYSSKVKVNVKVMVKGKVKVIVGVLSSQIKFPDTLVKTRKAEASQ